MVAYYENEAAVDEALRKVKTPEDARKIYRDTERMAAATHTECEICL